MWSLQAPWTPFQTHCRAPHLMCWKRASPQRRCRLHTRTHLAPTLGMAKRLTMVGEAPTKCTCGVARPGWDRSSHVFQGDAARHRHPAPILSASMPRPWPESQSPHPDHLPYLPPRALQVDSGQPRTQRGRRCRGGKWDHMWAEAQSVLPMLHCPIRLHLQNANSKMRSLRISRWWLQSINTKCGALLSGGPMPLPCWKTHEANIDHGSSTTG